MIIIIIIMIIWRQEAAQDAWKAASAALQIL